MTKTPALRLCSILFIAFCLIWAPSIAASSQPEFRFTILHTNDLHAHDQAYVDRGRVVGGMSRIAQLMRSIRSSTPNVVTVDAGDIFQGTPFFKTYHGATEIRMLNDAGYDIYTIGNHEFDDGPINLATQLKNAKFKVLSCNLDTSACPELSAQIQPSVIKTIDGQKVGFIGAITPDLQRMTLRTDGCKVISPDGDWIAPIRDEVARVKQQGVNKIVLVTHVGLELDRDLALLPDVDVIVGGHSHTRLEKPVIVTRRDGSKCVIVQAGSYGRAVGKLDLAFFPDGRVDLAHTNYRLFNITDRLPADPNIERYLEEQAKPFEYMRKEIVGIAKADFDNGWRKYPGNTPLGDLIADAVANGAAKYGATISIHNRGGIRARIEKGPINQEKIEEILPFDNSLIVATIKGEDLRKALENSVGGTAAQSIMLGGKFLEVHGIRFAWEPRREPGKRVGNVWILDGKGQYAPLDANGDYRLAVNSYTFAGGEGYDFSKAKDVKDTNHKLSIYLHDYLLKRKTITPDKTRRIMLLSPIPSQFQNPNKSSH